MTHHIDLDTITLREGGHQTREQGVCAMEATAWLADEPHSDAPACTDPIIAAYVRNLNDAMPDDQRQRLKAYIPRLIGTKLGIVPVDVAMRMADRAVRVHAVAALRNVGLTEDADKLAALAPVTDRDAASAASDAAYYAASDAAYAASYAAYYAARDAAYAASYAASAASDAASAASYAASAASYAASAASDAASAASYAASAARYAASAASYAASAASYAASAASDAASAARYAAYSAARADDRWAEPLAMLDELLALCEVPA